MRLLALCLPVLITISCNTSTTESRSDSAPQHQHHIANKEIHDTKGKAQLTVDIVLDVYRIDSVGVREILDYYFNSYRSYSGFKYHDEPTVLSIRVYGSEEHYNAQMGQWMAEKLITPLDDSPRYNFNRQYISGFGKQAEEKWGLAEEKRKEIWRAIVKAEDRATDEAEDTYPLNGMDPDFKPENIDKNLELSKELMDKYRTEVYSKYGITKAIADSISREAFIEGWPFPR